MNPPFPEDIDMHNDLEATMTAEAPPYTITKDSITVILDGVPKVIPAGTPQYAGLKSAILRDAWSELDDYLTRDGALARWLGESFKVSDGKILDCDGFELPEAVADKITTMAAGSEDPTPLLNFYTRLRCNPSRRSVQQLFTFLGHLGIPLEPDGTFLAYKGVREDFLDQHSGTLMNTPGTTQRMPRNQISDDPRTPCHEGLHVGALEYARGFSSRVVICRIDPANVVCVPFDCSAQKMRVCEYEVIGQWVGQDEATTMPSTSYTPDVPDEGDDDADWGGEVEYSDDLEVDPTDGDVIPVDEPIPYAPTAPSSQQDDPQVAPSLLGRRTKQVVLTAKPTAPRAASFNRKSPAKLMDETLDDLRAYAGKHLKIVGAYHIPGGKSKLVSAILKARRRKSAKRGRK